MDASSRRLRHYFVWCFTFIGAIAGLCVWLLQPPMFEAKTRLRLIPVEHLPATSLQVQEQKALIEQARSLLTSPAVLEQLLKDPQINAIFSTELSNPTPSIRLHTLLRSASQTLGIENVEIHSPPIHNTLSFNEEKNFRERMRYAVSTNSTASSFSLNLIVSDQNPLLAKAVSQILPRIATELLQEKAPTGFDSVLNRDIPLTTENQKIELEKLKSVITRFQEQTQLLSSLAVLIENPDSTWPKNLEDSALHSLRDELIRERLHSEPIRAERGWASIRLQRALEIKRDEERKKLRQSRATLVSTLTRALQTSPEILNELSLTTTEVKNIFKTAWGEDRIHYDHMLTSLDSTSTNLSFLIKEIRSSWANPEIGEMPRFRWEIAFGLGALTGLLLGLTVSRFWLRKRLPLFSATMAEHQLGVPVLGFIRSSSNAL